MLELKKSIIEKVNNLIVIKATISKDSIHRELFYAVDENLEEYIDETLNPFVFSSFLIAVQEKEDLKITGPCSQRFIYGVKNLLNPAFKKMGLYTPKIYAETLMNDFENINISCGCATGLSGGIDSLCTVLDHLQNPESKLTHLVQFFPNHRVAEFDRLFTKDKHTEQNDAYNDKMSREFNLPVVKVYSNFMEYIKYHFEQVHAFCNVSHAMLLKGMISKYLYSTGYPIEKTCLNFEDTSHYELLICQVVNRPDFEMISYQPAFSRMDKTMSVAKSEVAQKNLCVCVKNDIGNGNCTTGCFKCARTITSLEALGVLEKFKDSFDLDLYSSEKNRIWGDMLYRAYIMNDVFAKEIVLCAKKNNMKISSKAKRYMFKRGFNSIINKIKHSIKK